MKKQTFYLLALVALTACSKKKSNPTPTPRNPTATGKCKIEQLDLSTQFSLSQGAVQETDLISYTGDLIESITISTSGHQLDGSKTSFVYSNSKLVRINYNYRLNGGTPSSDYDSVFYDASGRVILLKKYKSDASLSGGMRLTHNNGLLIKREYMWGGSLTDVWSHDEFEYDGNNLIVKVRRYDGDGVEYDNIKYSYGNQENKLFKDNNQIDLYLHTGFGGDQDLLYYGLLNNSKLIGQIVHTKTSGSPQTYNITYDLNSNGYPTAIKSNGSIVLSGKYNCK